MTTGQFPKRRETDRQAQRRVETLQHRRNERASLVSCSQPPCSKGRVCARHLRILT